MIDGLRLSSTLNTSPDSHQFPIGDTEIDLIRRNSECAGPLGDYCVTQGSVLLALELGAGDQKCIASAALAEASQADRDGSRWPTKAYKQATTYNNRQQSSTNRYKLFLAA